jgi:hypothetical protein
MGELVFCEAKSQPNRTLVLRSRLSFVSSYYLPLQKKKKKPGRTIGLEFTPPVGPLEFAQKKKFDHWKNKAQNQSVLQRAGPRNINLRTQPIAPHLLSPTLQRQKNNYKYSWTTMTPNAT